MSMSSPVNIGSAPSTAGAPGRRAPTGPRDNAFAIGIDVGGTEIAGGLLSLPNGYVLARQLRPTQAERGGREVLNDVLAVARELGAVAKERTETVSALGVGICELVNRDGRLASANCIRWLDLPVVDELSVIAPTVLEADVRAAALAESMFGAGRSYRQFLYVTIGTGISCCLMLDGEPYLGARGFTGTMASSPMAVPCEKCDHVSRRSLEEIASGPALVKRFQAEGGKAERGQDVLSAAAAGDERARRIVESGSEALESQIGLLISTLDPQAVVVGGGLGLSTGLYWDSFIAATRQHIWSEAHRDLPIARAATGSDAGWMGAAARAWKGLS
jgi:glucokinase